MKKVKELEIFAQEIRLQILRQVREVGFGHVGGAMSIADTLAVLYGELLRIRPEEPAWKERDQVVMSKGHSGPALYAALALKGYFPMETLLTLNKAGTILPSHCDRTKTPGVDMTTGSLGQGMSTAAGIALAQKMDGIDANTYLILGDGECNEGQVWEGAQFAAHYKLDNLIGFVDNNGYQLDGKVTEVLYSGKMGDKFASFGWEVAEVDGHDAGQIRDAIIAAKARSGGKPAMIILNTEKGHGSGFSETRRVEHHIQLGKDEIEGAVAEAESKLSAMKNAI